jgi:hypothetical protein
MKFAIYFSVLIMLFSGPGCGQIKNENTLIVKGDSVAAARLLTDTNRAILIPRPDTISSHIKIYGRHWFNNTKGQAAIQFWLNKVLIKSPDIIYFPDNTFLLQLPKLLGVRDYILTAIQQNDAAEKKTAEIHFNTRMQGHE